MWKLLTNLSLFILGLLSHCAQIFQANIFLGFVSGNFSRWLSMTGQAEIRGYSYGNTEEVLGIVFSLYSMTITIKHAGLGLLFAKKESCFLSMLKTKPIKKILLIKKPLLQRISYKHALHFSHFFCTIFWPEVTKWQTNILSIIADKSLNEILKLQIHS